jgi:hypothetical protein
MCRPSRRVRTIPTAFRIARCCERFAFGTARIFCSSAAECSRSPRRSSIRRRVAFANALQIPTCCSRICWSMFVDFDLLEGFNGDPKSQRNSRSREASRQHPNHGDDLWATTTFAVICSSKPSTGDQSSSGFPIGWRPSSAHTAKSSEAFYDTRNAKRPAAEAAGSGEARLGQKYSFAPSWTTRKPPGPVP